MILIFFILWYIIGLILLLLMFYKTNNEITLETLSISLLGGLIGPIALIIFLIEVGEDIVIFKKKTK